jgi:hypothetical protein
MAWKNLFLLQIWLEYCSLDRTNNQAIFALIRKINIDQVKHVLPVEQEMLTFPEYMC